MFYLNVCMCTVCLMSSKAEECTDPLELEIEIALSYHADARNQTQVL